MNHKHDIRLTGPSVQKGRISGPLLHDLLHVLVEGSQRALRFRLEGRSYTSGAVPSWLRKGSAFDVIAGRDGTAVHLEARSLREALPARFEQLETFPQVDPEKSALDLFEEGLADALDGKADSDLFDEGLVQTYAGLRDVFDEGVESLALVNGRELPVSLDGLRRVDDLGAKIPKPRRVRVAGRLDAIRHSDRMFTLVLDTGVSLRGLGAALHEAELAGLWGKAAVVSGMAYFRPSGTLSRIEAERVGPAKKNDLAAFQTVPKPVGALLDVRTLRVPQGPRSGINAIVGQWPGSESDEEVRAALGELR